MGRDYNRFLILYHLYDKHYILHFEWQDPSFMKMEGDLQYIMPLSYPSEIVYLQRKGYIEAIPSDSYPNKVRISGKGIDIIDHVINEYQQYLGTMIDEESRYEHRHLSAIGNSGDLDAIRSQLYFYIRKRKLSSSIFYYLLIYLGKQRYPASTILFQD
jgi:hypothetical protein